MKIQLQALSPIHIGTGEEFSPLDYIVKDQVFYRIPQDKLIRFVQEQIPNGPKAFADWISESYKELRETRDNRELSQQSNRINAFTFCQTQQKEKELIQFLKNPKNQIFQAPVLLDEFTKSRYLRAPVIPLGRVRESMKTGTGRPYVPGSSLKGSLRTALFFHYLKNHANKADVQGIIQDQLRSKATKEKVGLPLAHSAFFCTTEDTKRKKVKTDDEKMDLLKLVTFSDAYLENTANPLGLAKVNIYLVERKIPKDRSKPIFSEAVQQPQANYSEVILPGNTITFELDFNIDFLLQVKNHINHKGGIGSADMIQWIGIKDKVKNLFGLDLATLTPANKDEKQQEVLSHLLRVWSDFSNRQASSHEQWLEHFRQHDKSDRFTSRIKEGFQPVFDNQSQVLIHMGYGTGFQGMTALLYFLEDVSLKKEYKALLERYKVGNKPGNKGDYKLDLDRFPKSRRLVETEDSIFPMGWFIYGKPKKTGSKTAAPQQESAPAIPEYYTRPIDFKKPPVLDAVVVKAGTPNMVKVYIREDFSPEMPLNGYRNPIEVGKVVRVNTVFSKAGDLVQISFGKFK